MSEKGRLRRPSPPVICICFEQRSQAAALRKRFLDYPAVFIFDGLVFQEPSICCFLGFP